MENRVKKILTMLSLLSFIGLAAEELSMVQKGMATSVGIGIAQEILAMNSSATCKEKLSEEKFSYFTPEQIVLANRECEKQKNKIKNVNLGAVK